MRASLLFAQDKVQQDRKGEIKSDERGEEFTAAPPANSRDLAGGFGSVCKRFYTRFGDLVFWIWIVIFKRIRSTVFANLD